MKMLSSGWSSPPGEGQENGKSGVHRDLQGGRGNDNLSAAKGKVCAAWREGADASSLRAHKADSGQADRGYKKMHFNAAE